jgi:hypothetical protein
LDNKSGDIIYSNNTMSSQRGEGQIIAMDGERSEGGWEALMGGTNNGAPMVGGRSEESGKQELMGEKLIYWDFSEAATKPSDDVYGGVEVEKKVKPFLNQ